MIIKHYDPKNGCCYFTAEEVITKQLQIDTDSLLKINAILEPDEEKIDEGKIVDPTSFENGRNAICYNKAVREIQKRTGWDYCDIDFIKNGNNYLDLNNCIVVLLKNRNPKEQRILVFNEMVYLMDNNGKTIERLI